MKKLNLTAFLLASAFAAFAADLVVTWGPNIPTEDPNARVVVMGSTNVAGPYSAMGDAPVSTNQITLNGAGDTTFLTLDVTTATNMTLLQIRDYVDAWLVARWPTVVARQQNYFANKGRYWQGLKTHTIEPSHETNVVERLADRLDQSPTDQFENWRNVFPEWDGEGLPAAFQVDVYDGPDGKGWVLTVWVRIRGTVYTRAQNVGPQSYRTYGWRVHETDPEQ